jgi:membrane protein implicated in regulation of membrane protease activity
MVWQIAQIIAVQRIYVRIDHRRERGQAQPGHLMYGRRGSIEKRTMKSNGGAGKVKMGGDAVRKCLPEQQPNAGDGVGLVPTT